MFCFVRLDNNVVRVFLLNVSVYIYVEKKRLCLGADNGKWENRKQATDGDHSVATGVLHFAHTNIGIIFIFVCTNNEQQISVTIM